MAVEIGTPYQFNHVTHVGFDHTTGGFVGLPPEWERVLRGEAPIESINTRNISPPNPYRRESAMMARKNDAENARRRKPSCLASILGRCFGSQSTYDLDSRPISAGRAVNPSRLETSERSSSVPPPYDSVKTYDEVDQRTLSSRRALTPPTQ